MATITITSTSFPIGGDYQVRWSRSATFENPDDIIVLAEGSNPRDSYSIVVSFAIPEAKYGVNYLQLVRYGADDIISFQFTVKPSIKVEPEKAQVGQKITIKGYGFPASEDGTVVLDGITPGMPFSASKLGSFSIEMLVPECIAGTHKLVANQSKLFADTPSATFNVVPYVTLTPENPEVGADVTISGKGFAASSQVTIKYDNKELNEKPTTDGKGNFSHTFKVTEGTGKEHKIIVTDKAGNTATYGMPLETTPPPKPAILSPRNAGQTFGFIGSAVVTFNWTPVSDPSGVTYTIEVGENLEFFPLKPGMRKSGLTETSTTIEIPPGTYFWRVRAIDGAGNEGEWSISPHYFKVGIIPMWYLIGGAIVILIVFILLLRAFFKRLRDYYS